MNKNEIIEKVLKFNFDTSEYWLLMGSAMVMHGLKESTRDIDIGCSAKLFESLAQQGYEVVINRIGLRKITMAEDIEIFENWTVDEIEMINGIPVSSLQSVISMKSSLGRPKDIDDIKLIKEKLCHGD